LIYLCLVLIIGYGIRKGKRKRLRIRVFKNGYTKTRNISLRNTWIIIANSNRYNRNKDESL
jgi:hypothetical protein